MTEINDNNKKKKRGKKGWLIALIICILLAVGAIIYLVVDIITQKRAQDDYDRLRQMAVDVTATPTPTAAPTAVPTVATDEQKVTPTQEPTPVEEPKREQVEIPAKEIDWDALHAENPDIYAWIYVPGTSIDYPVLQHPSNNDYYLNHNLDGSSGFPGVIYTENYNSKDFTDPNTVVYGHNMDNTTMFSTLHNFRDPDMVSEPHYIYIYTEDGRTLVYEIYAAYIYPSIHLLLNFDVKNDYIYEQYLRNISNMDLTSSDLANIRHDIDVTVSDRIITLSTCTTDHDASKRFLVTGVLLNP